MSFGASPEVSRFSALLPKVKKTAEQPPYYVSRLLAKSDGNQIVHVFRKSTIICNFGIINIERHMYAQKSYKKNKIISLSNQQ